MCRQDFGMPRSPISQVTMMGGLRRKGPEVPLHVVRSRKLLAAKRFWERMKFWNLIGSRTKKTGVLLPTMS